MSIRSNVTDQDLNNFGKLAELQKNQRTIKIKSRILKQTLDRNLAEYSSPITKKVDEYNETTDKLGEKVEKPDVEVGSSQTPAIEKKLILKHYVIN